MHQGGSAERHPEQGRPATARLCTTKHAQRLLRGARLRIAGVRWARGVINIRRGTAQAFDVANHPVQPSALLDLQGAALASSQVRSGTFFG